MQSIIALHSLYFTNQNDKKDDIILFCYVLNLCTIDLLYKY